MAAIQQILSYVFDWLVLVALAAAGAVMGNVTPNKRPFSLTDPDISFPFTEHETVPLTILAIATIAAPIVLIFLVCALFVPGPTTPKGIPRSLIWRRKLWELHIGWLGLATSLVAAWFITNGMKNLFGKPRPDLISRCEPDLENVAKYVVGGIAGAVSNGQLVSAGICKSKDHSKLDDGFRSYPSGHSSSSAAGLIYLSLFLASKFAVTIPFLPGYYLNTQSYTAFPSRLQPSTFDSRMKRPTTATEGHTLLHPIQGDALAQHRKVVGSARQQAAAAPLYLLVLVLIPTFAAVFIASSRWFDFRHHGFDILFGFLIGTLAAFFSFRYYHLPISQGAGWAWGPRSREKAFWAGVGSYSYATNDKDQTDQATQDMEMGILPPHGSRS